MKFWNSMLAAIGMYTGIPVKRVDWTEDKICYMLCFVPLAGVITGALQYGMWILSRVFRTGNTLFACVACCIPLLVTGGVHMAGFCHTVDALSAYRVRERRLETLNNPQTGAFAVIGCGCYFLFQMGFFSTVTFGMTVMVMGAAAVLARCAGCLMAVFLRNVAKSDSGRRIFDAADKPVTAAVLVFVLIAVLGVSVWIDTLSAMLMLLGTALSTIYCVTTALRQFGGVTEEIMGFSIQVIELSGAAMAAIGGLLWNL